MYYTKVKDYTIKKVMWDLGSRRSPNGLDIAHTLGFLLSLSLSHITFSINACVLQTLPSLVNCQLFLWVTSALNILPLTYSFVFCSLRFSFVIMVFFLFDFFIGTFAFQWGSWTEWNWNMCSVYHETSFKISDFL